MVTDHSSLSLNIAKYNVFICYRRHICRRLEHECVLRLFNQHN